MQHSNIKVESLFCYTPGKVVSYSSAYANNVFVFMKSISTKQHNILLLEAIFLPHCFDMTTSFTSLCGKITACYPKQDLQQLSVKSMCSSANLWFCSESYINLCL